jgi:hypothetical protein
MFLVRNRRKMSRSASLPSIAELASKALCALFSVLEPGSREAERKPAAM